VDQIHFFESILLGLIQGLTEFLPVSSSGHLVVFQTILGVKGPTLLFDLVLHFGTLLAILIVFRQDFILLMKQFSRPGIHQDEQEEERGGARHIDENLRIWILIIVGSVPTFILAFLIHDPVENAFHSSRLVGLFLFLTGLFLAVTRWIKGEGRGVQQMRGIDALVIGFAQGIAVVPGISRSGITIVAGLLMGLKGEVAAKFSFLLSVPTIIGAIVFQFWEEGGLNGGYSLPIELVGCGVALLSGILALKVVIGLVSSGRLYTFSFYCIPLGILVFIWS